MNSGKLNSDWFKQTAARNEKETNEWNPEWIMTGLSEISQSEKELSLLERMNNLSGNETKAGMKR